MFYYENILLHVYFVTERIYYEFNEISSIFYYGNLITSLLSATCLECLQVFDGLKQEVFEMYISRELIYYGNKIPTFDYEIKKY